MNIVNANASLILAPNTPLKTIEQIGRIAYQSGGKITTDSAEAFVQKIISNGHESVIEHLTASVIFVVDRGVSHEIVRHRLASYTQESTRYCNYTKGEANKNGITFIKPCFWDEGSFGYTKWVRAMQEAEDTYNALISYGETPQQARSVLPNSLKTELFVTMNLREWRHFFKLRTSVSAHPQMREVTLPLLSTFKTAIPIIFDDIKPANS
jgi:thymidylate synthase (FAD)